jgi:hypothetical protein
MYLAQADKCLVVAVSEGVSLGSPIGLFLRERWARARYHDVELILPRRILASR